MRQCNYAAARAEETMMEAERPKPRLIKKYKNRRLYDLEISQYITIDNLQHYLLEGVAFQVVEASSNKDITNAVLLQIFVEMEANSIQFLSSEMLRQLICLAHHPMSQSFKKMLEQMMSVMEKQSQNGAYLNTFKKASDAWNEQMQQLINQWQALFQK